MHSWSELGQSEPTATVHGPPACGGLGAASAGENFQNPLYIIKYDLICLIFSGKLYQLLSLQLF